ncbi:cytolysin secretion protein [Vibrio caribbeanicus]|uniref:cytolysin secretion protein n=1 Tax=Vibrio caribbeanicus TaxID=701175 RepID=UPI0030DBD431
MRLNIRKISIILISSFVATSASATIQMIGQENEVSESISQHFQQPVETFTGHLSKGDLLYINVGTASKDEISVARSHASAGDTVVVDLTTLAGDEEKMEFSHDIAGMGMSVPVMVTGVYQGENSINAIISEVVDENGNPINSPEAQLMSIKQSLISSLTRLGFGEK